MAGKALPLGNKPGMANPAGALRYFAQQFPLRPSIGAAQRGPSASQPIASSAFASFNSPFRALPFPSDRPVTVGPGLPAVPQEPMQGLRKRMMQAAKTPRENGGRRAVRGRAAILRRMGGA